MEPPIQPLITNKRSEKCKISSEFADIQNTYTQSLPAELWLCIITHIKWTVDLFNLSLVSRALRTLSLSSFKTLNLFPINQVLSNDARLLEFKVLRLFHSSPSAEIVKELYITLPCFPAVQSPGCMCRTIDLALGCALQAMVNLETLDITCIMCLSRTTRHHYLSILDAPPHLQTISLRCRCGSPRILPPSWAFCVPLLNHVKSLRWSQGSALGYPLGIGEDDGSPGVPELKALVYHGKAVESKLIELRPVQRLYIVDQYRYGRAHFLPALKACASILTHIIHEIFGELKILMDAKPHSFTNVQHIGTLPSFPIDDAVNLIELHLAPYSSLSISSIDVTVVDDRDPWNEQILSRIQNSHQSLRRVLVHGDKFCVWELRGDISEKRDMRRFSAWDIIRGIYD